MAKVYYTAHKEFSLMGAFAVRKDQIFDTEALGILPTAEKRAEFDSLNGATGVIVVSQVLKDTLRPEHLAAIIAHEQAHIDCGHIHRVNEVGAHGVIDNMGYEIQADLGAAAVTGPKVMRKALVATCATLINSVVVELCADEEKKAFISRKVRESIKPRLAALRAYK